MKKALVLGAGGFIGGHLVTTLRDMGYYVRGVDIKDPEFGDSDANEFYLLDLADPDECYNALSPDFPEYDYEPNTKDWDEIYQLAADMGGAGYIFTGENDLDVMSNSAKINLNVVTTLVEAEFKGKIFYSSSACMYPQENQVDPNNPTCEENTAYPANPDSEYGWEKLFSERLYLAANRNYGLDVRIARYHNIFGPKGTWTGGKEKAPAALCRKVAEASLNNDDMIEVWGDGLQTRSFLYITECINATLSLMNSEYVDPVNIGSEEMLSINELANIIINLSSNRDIHIKNIEGPEGVRGRSSNNNLFQERHGWNPGVSVDLTEGLRKTYPWILSQVKKEREK